MGAPRRFLNLIVENPCGGTKSLRCIDLNRQKVVQHRSSRATAKSLPQLEKEHGRCQFEALVCTTSSPRPGNASSSRHPRPSATPNATGTGAARAVGPGSSPRTAWSTTAPASAYRCTGPGPYCLDTAAKPHAWSTAAEWSTTTTTTPLPFQGKFEYAPELRLWFGLSAQADARRLTAADLSDTGSSPPRVVGAWDEMERRPHGWAEVQEPQLVSMGAGRFCVARFFYAWVRRADWFETWLSMGCLAHGLQQAL
ncbi:hypothetical protein PR202_gb21568 [Eleusine coracana subsp. coracana]|uniref:Uncharacterized protein n=1 Tax=Eleusine coracana subsp. coracana TaxID=191504 RepID=A0AAV5FDI6_ELECO|nr:hypothetical protein PR202_gb21568 [Eleusine coracana subsp. coracana]